MTENSAEINWERILDFVFIAHTPATFNLSKQMLHECSEKKEFKF